MNGTVFIRRVPAIVELLRITGTESMHTRTNHKPVGKGIVAGTLPFRIRVHV